LETNPPIADLLRRALEARTALFDAGHVSALRVINGFVEGLPALTAEVFGHTLVLYNHAKPPESAAADLEAALRFYRQQLPWLECVLVKTRRSSDLLQRRGVIAWGQAPAAKICEQGVWYALNLQQNQDASFYVDMRGLRAWAMQNLMGKRVLNTFAYTGSLGVAALAGGAAQVVHVDLNPEFLAIAKASAALNGFLPQASTYIRQDFFPTVSDLKRRGEQFDGVFLDPPFFSSTRRGRVDLVGQSARLINKVRPLVKNGGWIVAVNNALFVSGREYLAALEALCADGYLTIEQSIPVPEDCAGYPQTQIRALPADPAPFNHATKIVLLRVRHRSQSN
jgi:23S rRNA (cytosine1962-C5)-methyltransferase